MLQQAVDTSLVHRSSGDLTDDILSALGEGLVRREWGALCRLVWLVQCFPDRKFTPLLCEMFDNYRDSVDMEGLADAFWDLNDERAVPSLIGGLDYYVAGDDLSFHFNKKVIHALSRIGTREAIEGIKTALGSPEPEIRRAAEQELERIEGGGEPPT
jgi:hypothetical protein